MIYEIKIKTSRNVTHRFTTNKPLKTINIDDYIKLVMDVEVCPERSIIKVEINNI